MRKLALIPLFLAVSFPAFPQGGQIRGNVLTNQNGFAAIEIPTTVQVCQYNMALQCNTLVGLFSDPALLNAMSNPFNTDPNGGYQYYASPGNYLQKTCLPYQQCITVVITVPVPGSGGGSGTPAPPNTSLQFNNSGAFGGNANLTYISPTTSSIGLNGMVQNGPGLSVAPFSTLPSPWNTMSQYLVPIMGNNFTNEFIISPNPNYSSGAINILTGSTGGASNYQTSSITTYNWATNDIGSGIGDQAIGLVTFGLANPPNGNADIQVIGLETNCSNVSLTYTAGSCVGVQVEPTGPSEHGKFNYVYGLNVVPQEAAIATYGIHVGFGSPAHSADRALWIQGPTQLGGTVQVEQYLYVNTEASGGYLFGGNYYSLFVADLNNYVVTPIVSIGTVQNQYHTADRAFLSSGTALSEFDGGIMQPLVTPSDVGPCIAGQIQLDASYIYVCTATNVYKRAALSSF